MSLEGPQVNGMARKPTENSSAGVPFGLDATTQDLIDAYQGVITVIAAAWQVTAAILVFFMQYGFTLLEAGTVQKKNTRNIVIKNTLDTCVCALSFWAIGYSLAFGYGNGFFGWHYWDTGAGAFFTHREQVEFFFQFTFAATASTIIAGAVAERTRIEAYLLYNFMLSGLIYPVIAHMLWSGDGLLAFRESRTIFGSHGVLDDAGSMVVHVTGGVASLVGAWTVGPRLGRFDIDGNPVELKCHSMVQVAAGTLVLWAGFYGFNGGSVVRHPDVPAGDWINKVASVCMNTTLTAAASSVTVFFILYFRKRQNPLDNFNAVIGGLVAACATASIVAPYAAVVTGIGAGFAYTLGVWVLLRLKIDDVVMASPTHLFCGSWGSIAAGLFARRIDINVTYGVDPQKWGLFTGGGISQLGIQILALGLVYVWVGSTTFLLFFIMKRMAILRVLRRQEEVGLDVAFHGSTEVGVIRDGRSHVVGSIARKTWRRLCRATGGGGQEGGGSVTSRLRLALSQATAILDSGQVMREVSQASLSRTPLGKFSLTMYAGNYIMEDTGEVTASDLCVWLAVHDGHGGTECSSFLQQKLYEVSKGAFLEDKSVTVGGIKKGFARTEELFTELVRSTFDEAPHMATVGSCSVVVVITATEMLTANCGDCRAVLGRMNENNRVVAVQLSEDHNINAEKHREEFISEHADTPDAAVLKDGVWRVKGKLQVSRAFGDLFLKTEEFNREPLFSRFRAPEPLNPPQVSAEPHVSLHTLSRNDGFVVLASDGLWEHLSNQEVVDMVAANPRKNIARLLVRTALERAARKKEVPFSQLVSMPSGPRRVYHDDITVIVFFFNHRALEQRRGAALAEDEWALSVSFKGGNHAKEALDAYTHGQKAIAASTGDATHPLDSPEGKDATASV